MRRWLILLAAVSAIAWDTTRWPCSVVLTLTQSSGVTWTNEAVRVAVTYRAGMQADFSDVRFVSVDGSVLYSHWWESRSNSVSAVAWVRLPLAEATTSLRMHYCGPASEASDGHRVFPRFENYSANWSDYGEVAANGAWYSYEADPRVYGSAAGTYFTTHRPQAVRFNVTTNRTYMVYGGAGSISTNWITYYDHATAAMGTAVAISANPNGDDDAHANPTLAIDGGGYLYVTYGMETSNAYLQRSTNPEDISAWDAVVGIATPGDGTGAQYLSPIISGNNLYVFYRQLVSNPTQRRYGYKSAPLTNLVFSAFVPVIDFAEPSNIYAATEQGTNGTVHLAWTNYEYYGGTNSPQYRNVYHVLTTNLVDWTTHGGTPITLPVTNTTADLVYSTGTTNDCWVLDLALDENGRPNILSIIGTRNATNDNRGTFRYNLHRHDGTAWRTTTVGPAVDHLFDRGALVVRNSGSLSAFLNTTNVRTNEDGGNLVEYTSTDGTNWTEANYIAAGTAQEHAYPRTVKNGTADFKLLWSFGSAAPTKVYAWGDGSYFAGASYTNTTLALAGQSNNVVNGGVITITNNLLQFATATNGHSVFVTFNGSLPTGPKVVTTTFTPKAAGTAYRFLPAMLVWDQTGLNNGNRWGPSLLWFSSGLYLYWTPTNGGTTTNVQLTATTPTVDASYAVTLAHATNRTYVSVIKTSDSSVVYTGQVTTSTNFVNAALYAGVGQYSSTSAGAARSWLDDIHVRQYADAVTAALVERRRLFVVQE